MSFDDPPAISRLPAAAINPMSFGNAMISRPAIRTRRRGTSLVEGLIASVLLATSVVGISGVIASSYQIQTQVQLRRDAAVAGREVMETVTALPLDPATVGQSSLADFQPASQTTTTTTTTGLLGGILPSVNINLLGIGISIGGSSSAPKATPAALAAAAPTISVDRRATLNGTTSATGDFALVTVLVPTDGKQAPLKLRRLVTSAEAAANQAP